MERRLYFLFPDIAQTRRVVHELLAAGIAHERMHAMARTGLALADLPTASARQQDDLGHQMERWLWVGNLVVFTAALAALLWLLLQGVYVWAWLPLLVMLATFIAGERFAARIPNTHLDEFADALQHGEILLMVDVPRSRVAEVEARVHRAHPEAAVGGVGWVLPALGV